MSQDSEPPDSQLDAPDPVAVESLELFRRSPHPYLRHKSQIRRPSPDAIPTSSPHSSTPLRSTDYTISDEDGRERRKTPSQSPSESGTEADDEAYSFVKALPAPPLRPHKGLRDARGSGQDEWASPLLTPTQIDDEGRKLSEYEENKTSRKRKKTSYTDDEAVAVRQKYLKRRRNEVVRRVTETALLAGISIIAVQGCGCWASLLEWHRGEIERQIYSILESC